MPFGIRGFSSSSKLGFDKKFSKKLEDEEQFNKAANWKISKSPFNINGNGKGGRHYENSEVAFFNTDSLWSRWRRGYELYVATQSFFGSLASERKQRGDYRVYFTFQQFPGVFIPARIYTFPSVNQESGEQMVGMRDTDAFSFYDFGLPILAVRYLGDLVSGSYSQSGTTLVVTKSDHGLYPGESVFLDFQTGSGIDETLSIVSTTQNSFTVTASNSITTSGNVSYYLSTTFADSRWTTTRVRLRSLPTEVSFFTGERLADRIVEKDPGIASTYSRSGSTVTITCSASHGLSSDNKVFIDVTSGDVPSGRYIVTVTSSTELTITTITSGSTSGNLTLSRLLRGRRYDDYVGYTVKGSDASTNELIFQRADSYGAKTTDTVTKTVVPAHRGFTVGRFLTTELRWQCSCQDFSRRDSYDLYSELTSRRFPKTTPRSIKPGGVIQEDGTISDVRDDPGTFRDLGYVTINNFYQLPDYEDTEEFAVQNLMYYQLRWCKHIYAAMFALKHDEGNDPFSFTATYSQSGPNITLSSIGHGLTINTKIEITFTSGNAISGEYSVSSVVDDDNFLIVYPFSSSTSGYCSVSNLKKHDYVNSWLLEPNDKPIGAGLDKFNKNFEKEKERLQSVLESGLFVRQNTQWSGQKNITGNKNQPQDIANFDPSVLSMSLTDDIKRDEDGKLSRSGKKLNTTKRMLTLINKLFNRVPALLEDIKFGVIDKPLDEYETEFESGLVDNGEYLNGIPVESSSTVSTIDCGTYIPLTDQDTIIDSDLYINT